MKTASPLLLPLLRSRSQGEIIAAIMLNPDAEPSLSELAADTGVSVATVLREVDRLEEAGLVMTRRRGNTRLVRPITDSAVFKPLADLMAVTFGPVGVLRTALSDVPGIERAFIFGSWAARHSGIPGDVPRDLDVIMIGTPNREQLSDAIEAAEATLRREVIVRRFSTDAWAADQSPFKQTVLSRPVVDLIGNSHERAVASRRGRGAEPA